jgi:hypothetical protein
MLQALREIVKYAAALHWYRHDREIRVLVSVAELGPAR